MVYVKTTWSDRVVENPLTYTLVSNQDGTTTLVPAEGSIIETGTPITSSALNNIENGIAIAHTDIAKNTGDITTIWDELFTNPYEIPRTHIDYDGAHVMKRASEKLYLTGTANANFLVSIQDTSHSHYYEIAVVHFQFDDYLQYVKLSGNQLTVWSNTLGTLSVMDGAGPYKFTIIGLGGWL